MKDSGKTFNFPVALTFEIIYPENKLWKTEKEILLPHKKNFIYL